MKGRVWTGAVVGAGVLALLAAGFLLGGPRRAIDWRDQRAVVIHSDDWGFAGFAPDSAAWRGIDRAALEAGRFPPTYWNSTLESAADVAALAEILAAVRGRDGGPAVLQPNYILGALSARRADGDTFTWRRHVLPELPTAYARPGMWEAVAAARERGVWHAELHGAWHYDPRVRRARAVEDATARRALARGITVFRGAHGARELGAARPRADIVRDLDTVLPAFAALFGRRPASVIAPDYTWSSWHEDLWCARGIRIVQAKREQRDPQRPTGPAGRARKWLERRLREVTGPDRTYVERNCRFETAQHGDAASVARSCLADVARAWRRGEPAVIETHRVNYVNLDRAVAATGRRQLAGLLGELAGRRPGPVFLSDDEVAQLERRGVSVVRRGAGLVVRNASHARRVAAVPAASRTAREGAGSSPLLVAVPAGATVHIERGRDGWRTVR